MRHKCENPVSVCLFAIAVVALFFFGVDAQAAGRSSQIVHDAEYSILEAQNGERWAAEDAGGQS